MVLGDQLEIYIYSIMFYFVRIRRQAIYPPDLLLFPVVHQQKIQSTRSIVDIIYIILQHFTGLSFVMFYIYVWYYIYIFC